MAAALAKACGIGKPNLAHRTISLSPVRAEPVEAPFFLPTPAKERAFDKRGANGTEKAHSMPELPEVETTVNGLRPVLQGHRIARVQARRADLRRPIPVDLGQRLTGATVIGLGRRAKYGLIDTDRGDTLIFHLGMSGRGRVDPSEILPHDHVLIETDAHRLALNDPRRFGSLDLVETESLATWPPFAAMGPEPLG